jgi:uncharacterized membrane protein YoaT (DUF817 family)
MQCDFRFLYSIDFWLSTLCVCVCEYMYENCYFIDIQQVLMACVFQSIQSAWVRYEKSEKKKEKKAAAAAAAATTV